MDVSDPISAPKSDNDQPPPDDLHSPPPDRSDDVENPPPAQLPPAMAEELHAILDLSEGGGKYGREDEDVCGDGGRMNGLSERKEEGEVVDVPEGEGDAREDEEDEVKEEEEEEVVKDGWSEGVVENGNGCGEDGWNDGNGGEEQEWKEETQRRDVQIQYPVRPGAEDCNFYMRMGSCKFGSSCKFNHPPRSNQTVKPRMKEREDGSERSMHMECKYYMSAGGCKYGKACRFNHSRERPNVVPVLEYNFLSLPIRPGEKECPYYMRNGSCKYAAKCRFNHPEPTAGSDASPGYAKDEHANTWSSPRPSEAASAPFVPVSFPSAQGIRSHISEWNGYQVPIFTPEKSFHPYPAFPSNIPSTAKSAYSHFQPQLASDEFPERPGQPECTYFLKTGDCKFRSACKFHHPKDRIVQPSCAMTDKGLPLRPGQSICTHYLHYGICKFGPKCRYDHPINIQNAAPPAITGLHQPPHPFSNFASPAGVTR